MPLKMRRIGPKALSAEDWAEDIFRRVVSLSGPGVGGRIVNPRMNLYGWFAEHGTQGGYLIPDADAPVKTAITPGGRELNYRVAFRQDRGRGPLRFAMEVEHPGVPEGGFVAEAAESNRKRIAARLRKAGVSAYRQREAINESLQELKRDLEERTPYDDSSDREYTHHPGGHLRDSYEIEPARKL